MKRITLLAAVTLAFFSAAQAQVNEAAFNARGESNRAACDVIAQGVTVDDPGKVVAAMVAAKEKCIQERETKQYLQTMEGCQKAASRRASAMAPAPVHFKSCMNALGYDVVQ